MDAYAELEEQRARVRPAGDVRPDEFGEGNIYYGPALMWHELRERIGDDAFFALMREWPSRPRQPQLRPRRLSRSWLEEQTGEELTAFFDAWLLGEHDAAAGLAGLVEAR